MRTVLVTGANSGLGAATTAALLDRGATVIATVRSTDAAASVRQAHPRGALRVELLDVTDPVASREVVTRHRPDVVVNSAGDALLGPLMDTDDESVRQQFEAHVLGPNRLARFAVEHQRLRGHGRIVNVSSSLADLPLPFTGWYSAAKAALDATTDVLRVELRGDGIEVVRVECGPVRTPAWDHAGDAVLASTDAPSAPARLRWAELTSRAQRAFADPDHVGAVIADAALDEHPRAVYRVGPGSHLNQLIGLVPATVRDSLMALVFRSDRR
jgi:NAD(P)-dependent dehydrogenase (short-subunit alcohol dehydrogenase family)